MNKIANILISIVFLISFVGIQINKHYSHGELYDVSVFHEAESCCTPVESCCETDSKTSSHCDNQSNNDLSCENTIEVYRVIDNFIAERFSTPTICSLDLLFFATSISIEADLISISSIYNSFYSSPPIINPDFHSEFGVFLC